MPQLKRSDQRVCESLFRFSLSQSLAPHVIPQHELLRVRMEVDRLAHPLANRIPVQVMLEPMRSYVRGTIGGTNPGR
jgi:hypothetical protein